MNITKCKICEKPFFKDMLATNIAKNFDPNACKKCNQEAINNS